MRHLRLGVAVLGAVLVLGAAVGLRLWLPDVTGGQLLSERNLVLLALSGGGQVLAGAVIGQLACALLRRVLPLRVHPWRDLAILTLLHKATKRRDPCTRTNHDNGCAVVRRELKVVVVLDEYFY